MAPPSAGVARQSNYLRGPLPPGPGICAVCRGPVKGPYPRCWECREHHLAATDLLATAVVPIAYGIKGEQHYQHLVNYKHPRYPSAAARTRVQDLILLFLRLHWRCLGTAAGGGFTHLAVVPSTSGRTGPHPLTTLVVPPLHLPIPAITVNPVYPASDRSFHRDRFSVEPLTVGEPPARVLLLDDTWTTGARVQSLAHALRTSGAVSVIAVVLGRHIKDEYDPARSLLARVRRIPFDIGHCAVSPCLAQH